MKAPVLLLTTLALCAAPTMSLADIDRDMRPHTTENFPCNVFGDTWADITNRGTAPAHYVITWAPDQHESRSGDVDPGKTKNEKVGCGGIGTPGMTVTNDSDELLHVRTH